MQTVRVSEKTGSDGILHLRIPVGQPEAEFEAVVVLQPRTTGDAIWRRGRAGMAPWLLRGDFRVNHGRHLRSATAR